MQMKKILLILMMMVSSSFAITGVAVEYLGDGIYKSTNNVCRKIGWHQWLKLVDQPQYAFL